MKNLLESALFRVFVIWPITIAIVAKIVLLIMGMTPNEKTIVCVIFSSLMAALVEGLYYLEHGD